MTIGERIKAAREKTGMTQVELGEKVGVSGVAIMRYEKGQRQPRYDLLLHIADALGVSAHTLVDWGEVDKEAFKELFIWGEGLDDDSSGNPPKLIEEDGLISTPEVVEHSATPEELDALMAKLQDGKPLVLSPEELAKLKATPKKRVSSALERMKHEGVVVEVQSPLYKLRSMPQSGRVARFNKKFGVDFGDGETVSLDGKMGSGKSTVINELIKITNDPQHRIAAALDQLNDEGREKAAERVEELTEIPRYRAQNAPQDTPPAPGGTDGPQRPQEPPTGPSVIVLTMVCPLCARRITGDVVTKTAYCPNCKKSFPLPQK